MGGRAGNGGRGGAGIAVCRRTTAWPLLRHAPCVKHVNHAIDDDWYGNVYLGGRVQRIQDTPEVAMSRPGILEVDEVSPIPGYGENP